VKEDITKKIETIMSSGDETLIIALEESIEALYWRCVTTPTKDSLPAKTLSH